MALVTLLGKANGVDFVEKVRIDKWLWAARMFKTRSMASDACTGGHVKLDGETVKSSKMISVGSMIDVLTAGGPRVLEVIALGDKRGPAKVAQTLYNDHTPPRRRPAPCPAIRRLIGEVEKDEKGAGPTKRDRRRFTPDKYW